jgi:cyclopropane-fatty-acyl-phospholipid synthase
MERIGASSEAIQHHYDVGNEFFALWLDASMTYSCSRWDDGDDLERAQERKIDEHAARARIGRGARVLDIGCGWGGALRRIAGAHGAAAAVGLTLSPAQRQWSLDRPADGVEVRLENWIDHRPERRYDAILSVEAFDAFARPGLSPREKIAGYRTFFERCHDWLEPGGWLSLQTIAYGNAGPEDADPFIAGEIFPESDLPQLAEIAAAVERRFEVVSLANDRADYVRTLREWRARLRRNRARADAALAKRFDTYLRLSEVMFKIGTCDLYRLALRRIDEPRRRK